MRKKKSHLKANKKKKKKQKGVRDLGIFSSASTDNAVVTGPCNDAVHSATSSNNRDRVPETKEELLEDWKAPEDSPVQLRTALEQEFEIGDPLRLKESKKKKGGRKTVSAEEAKGQVEEIGTATNQDILGNLDTIDEDAQLRSKGTQGVRGITDHLGTPSDEVVQQALVGFVEAGGADWLMATSKKKKGGKVTTQPQKDVKRWRIWIKIMRAEGEVKQELGVEPEESQTIGQIKQIIAGAVNRVDADITLFDGDTDLDDDMSIGSLEETGLRERCLHALIYNRGRGGSCSSSSSSNESGDFSSFSSRSPDTSAENSPQDALPTPDAEVSGPSLLTMDSGVLESEAEEIWKEAVTQLGSISPDEWGHMERIISWEVFRIQGLPLNNFWPVLNTEKSIARLLLKEEQERSHSWKLKESWFNDGNFINRQPSMEWRLDDSGDSSRCRFRVSVESRFKWKEETASILRVDREGIVDYKIIWNGWFFACKKTQIEGCLSGDNRICVPGPRGGSMYVKLKDLHSGNRIWLGGAPDDDGKWSDEVVQVLRLSGGWWKLLPNKQENAGVTEGHPQWVEEDQWTVKSNLSKNPKSVMVNEVFLLLVSKGEEINWIHLDVDGFRRNWLLLGGSNPANVDGVVWDHWREEKIMGWLFSFANFDEETKQWQVDAIDWQLREDNFKKKFSLQTGDGDEKTGIQEDKVVEDHIKQEQRALDDVVGWEITGELEEETLGGKDLPFSDAEATFHPVFRNCPWNLTRYVVDPSKEVIYLKALIGRTTDDEGDDWNFSELHFFRRPPSERGSSQEGMQETRLDITCYKNQIIGPVLEMGANKLFVYVKVPMDWGRDGTRIQAWTAVARRDLKNFMAEICPSPWKVGPALGERGFPPQGILSYPETSTFEHQDCTGGGNLLGNTISNKVRVSRQEPRTVSWKEADHASEQDKSQTCEYVSNQKNSFPPGQWRSGEQQRQQQALAGAASNSRQIHLIPYQQLQQQQRSEHLQQQQQQQQDQHTRQQEGEVKGPREGGKRQRQQQHYGRWGGRTRDVEMQALPIQKSVISLNQDEMQHHLRQASEAPAPGPRGFGNILQAWRIPDPDPIVPGVFVPGRMNPYGGEGPWNWAEQQQQKKKERHGPYSFAHSASSSSSEQWYSNTQNIGESNPHQSQGVVSPGYTQKEPEVEVGKLQEARNTSGPTTKEELSLICKPLMDFIDTSSRLNLNTCNANWKNLGEVGDRIRGSSSGKRPWSGGWERRGNDPNAWVSLLDKDNIKAQEQGVIGRLRGVKYDEFISSTWLRIPLLHMGQANISLWNDDNAVDTVTRKPTTVFHGTRWPKSGLIIKRGRLLSGPRMAGGKQGVWSSPNFAKAEMYAWPEPLGLPYCEPLTIPLDFSNEVCRWQTIFELEIRQQKKHSADVLVTVDVMKTCLKAVWIRRWLSEAEDHKSLENGYYPSSFLPDSKVLAYVSGGKPSEKLIGGDEEWENEDDFEENMAEWEKKEEELGKVKTLTFYDFIWSKASNIRRLKNGSPDRECVLIALNRLHDDLILGPHKTKETGGAGRWRISAWSYNVYPSGNEIIIQGRTGAKEKGIDEAAEVISSVLMEKKTLRPEKEILKPQRKRE